MSYLQVVGGEYVTLTYELILDGFKLGIATKESTKEIHGLNPGQNMGCEIVVWTEDTDSAIQYLIENGGATMLSNPHNFLNDLRSGWIQDPDGNPIQIVCKRKNKFLQQGQLINKNRH